MTRRRAAARLCVLCNQRWAQSKLGLCRTCERTTGADLRNSFERERDRVERRRAARLMAPREEWQPYELTVDSRPGRADTETFVVVWNGTASGPGRPLED